MDKNIFIILPFKESLNPKISGAVSILIQDSLKYTKFKKSIKVISSDEFKNIKLFRNRNYIKNFCNKYKNHKIDLIEIHNRPEYIFLLEKYFPNTKITITFHNDPLSLRGSEKNFQREYLIKKCSKLIFISKWIKTRFFYNLNNTSASNVEIIYHGVKKPKNIKVKIKNKNILFVGKLNKSKGYDIYSDAAKKFKKINNDWKFIAIGDEPRKNIFPDKNTVNEIGYRTNKQVLKFYENSEIAVGNSVWNEPLGRIAIEASSRKCLPIISDVAGLKESKDIAYVLKKNTASELFKTLKLITNNNILRRNLQHRYYKNNDFDIIKISISIDKIREQILNKKLLIKKKKILKILHITNLNERFDGRLHYNTGKRINNGFVRLGHNVLTISDRDIISKYKTFLDPSGVKTLNNKILSCHKNFKADLIVLGHVDNLSKNIVKELQEINDVKVCQWFLDPLIKNGPDYIKNKKRILSLGDSIDATFLTTHPDALLFNIKNSHFIPNPCDSSFETLDNSKSLKKLDLFFAMSHGVHRGVLKEGKYDDREAFLKKLSKKLNNIKFDIFGMNQIQPIWGDNFINILKNYNMALNLSRGRPIKYYSSDRIAQLIGNGILTFIDSKTSLNKIISNKEAIFYKDIDDLVKKINYYKKATSLSKKIASNGKKNYFKKFKSEIVCQFIINKTLNINSKTKFAWI